MTAHASDGQALRYRGDRERAAILTARADVRAAAAAQAAQPERNLRRELLASSLRVSSVMAPAVVRQVEACRARLGIALAVEVYIYPSPQFNAGCTAPDEARVYVLLSSALVDGFQPDELAFVVGHELGHHVYAHHSIPSHRLLDGERPDPKLALELFAWQRAAEISADRAGLACCPGLAAAGRAMFKLTSGLAGDRIDLNLEEFLAQAGDLAAAEPAGPPSEDRREWFSTHPFSPLRVRALQLAAQSSLFGGALPHEALEADVSALLGIMEPGYRQEKSDAAEAMRRVLFAGGLAIATAGAGAEVTAAERAALESLLGPGAVPDQVDGQGIAEVLVERLARVRALAAPERRWQVLRDLAVIARADGRTDPAEVAVLRQVAVGLDLDPGQIAVFLEQGPRGLD